MTTVLFFGALAEITGCNKLELEGFKDTGSLQEELVKRYPVLSTRQFALALNQQLIREHAPLPEYSTLAFLPPFSGG